MGYNMKIVSVTLPTYPDFPNELLTYYLKVRMNLILTTKVYVNTKNKLLSAQLRLTAGFSQTERRDEGQNVFCFFFPTGFTTFLQLVLCPLIPPPLSG